MPAVTEARPVATIRVQEEGGRYLVRLVRAIGRQERGAYSAITNSFRETFPTHGDRVWRQQLWAWSIPGTRRRRLEEWLAAQQQAGVAVVWDTAGATSATAAESAERA